MSDVQPRVGARVLAVLAALLLVVPALILDSRGAAAQDGEIEAEVIVRGSLEDAGDGTGAFVIEVESVERLASAIEVVLNYGPGIEMVRDDASQPACQIGSPWAGSCGPFEPDGQAIIAAFAFSPARELGTEVLVRLPVLLSGNADDQSWNLSIGGVWDFDGRPVDAVVAGGPSAAAFLNVTPDCDREILVVTSDLPVVEASLVDVDGIATELALVEVAPGVYEAVPTYWDFAYVTVATDRDGVVVETDQYIGGIACDLDRDGVPDPVDNCPGSYNPSQSDFDDNGIGDSCDGTVVNCGNGLFRVATSHAPTLEALIAASDASECWSVAGGGPDFELSLALFGVDPQVTIDLTPLTALKNLEIIDSGLTSLPTGLTSLEGLVGLGLTGNALSELPPEIGELENLTTLLLTDNEFVDVPLEAWTKPGLRRLSLASNRITSLPSGVSDGLQQLYLMENQLTGDLTSFLDAWYSVDRDHGDDALLRIDDGPGGNDCVKTANPEASVVWGLRRIALECDAEVVVEGRVWTPDGVTGVFGAQVCAERPLLETLCVFTDVFGDYRFDNVGQGNINFTMTDPARRYEAPPTGFIGLVLSEGAATIDFETFFVGLGGVDPGPEPTPTPGPEPTPTPDPEPTPMPPEPTPEPPSGSAMPGTISGHFFDDLGAPMPGGQVCVEVALVGTETCTTADGTGRFFFGGLFSGNYVVAAYANGEVVDTYQYASVSPTQGVTGITLRNS